MHLFQLYDLQQYIIQSDNILGYVRLSNISDNIFLSSKQIPVVYFFHVILLSSKLFTLLNKYI